MSCEFRNSKITSPADESILNFHFIVMVFHQTHILFDNIFKTTSEKMARFKDIF